MTSRRPIGRMSASHPAVAVDTGSDFSLRKEADSPTHHGRVPLPPLPRQLLRGGGECQGTGDGGWRVM
jgi:hypothetical protein